MLRFKQWPEKASTFELYHSDNGSRSLVLGKGEPKRYDTDCKILTPTTCK